MPPQGVPACPGMASGTAGAWVRRSTDGVAIVRSVPPERRSFAESLADPAAFRVIVELVSWRGTVADEAGSAPLGAARELAGDPRIAALSITDNAGGHPMLTPVTLADEFVSRGQDVIVHVACRDRSRGALQSLGWELRSHGLSTILAVSGDYPVEGYGGLSRAVFDMDSVGLLQLYGSMGGFTAGAVVNGFKRHERELVPQYLKLVLKVRAGARFVISQVGYDAGTADELLRWMRLHDLQVPAIASAYILGRGVARAFHAGRIPGCVVTDELLALVERQAGSPDRGRAFFLEFAAKQAAVARGLGYRGVYLSGHRDARDIERILEMVAGFGPEDWRGLVGDVSFPIPGAFRYFTADTATGLGTDQVDPAYLRSRTRRARRRLRRSVDYRVNWLVHRLAFTPGSAGFRVGAAVYGAAERAHVAGPLHVLEQAIKIPLYDCRDCGDCSLPDIAYLCPESHCPKNQRNGPCGGSHDGRCEVGDRPCIWASAYDRLKPYGEELAMLDRPPVIQDNALRRSSAWANTFLERDHFAHRERRER